MNTHIIILAVIAENCKIQISKITTESETITVFFKELNKEQKKMLFKYAKSMDEISIIPDECGFNRVTGHYITVMCFS